MIDRGERFGIGGSEVLAASRVGNFFKGSFIDIDGRPVNFLLARERIGNWHGSGAAGTDADRIDFDAYGFGELGGLDRIEVARIVLAVREQNDDLAVDLLLIARVEAI